MSYHKSLISVGSGRVNAITWNKQEKNLLKMLPVMITIFQIHSSGCILSPFGLHLIRDVRLDALALSDAEAWVK